jgi:Na+-driven multidrug efflux pump
MMGSGNTKAVIRDSFNRMTLLSIASSALFALILVALSGLYPMLYNTTDSVRALSTQIILVMAAMMPFHGYIHAVYFAMRSGGKTGITFLFDCGYTVAIELPVAMLLCRFTGLDTWLCYLLVQQSNWIKVLLGGWLVGKGVWRKIIV